MPRRKHSRGRSFVHGGRTKKNGVPVSRNAVLNFPGGTPSTRPFGRVDAGRITGSGRDAMRLRNANSGSRPAMSISKLFGSGAVTAISVSAVSVPSKNTNSAPPASAGPTGPAHWKKYRRGCMNRFALGPSVKLRPKASSSPPSASGSIRSYVVYAGTRR